MFRAELLAHKIINQARVWRPSVPPFWLFTLLIIWPDKVQRINNCGMFIPKYYIYTMASTPRVQRALHNKSRKDYKSQKQKEEVFGNCSFTMTTMLPISAMCLPM